MGATHKLFDDDLLQLLADEFVQRWVALVGSEEARGGTCRAVSGGVMLLNDVVRLLVSALMNAALQYCPRDPVDPWDRNGAIWVQCRRGPASTCAPEFDLLGIC